jgi:hypothetical protein
LTQRESIPNNSKEKSFSQKKGKKYFIQKKINLHEVKRVEEQTESSGQQNIFNELNTKYSI